MDELQQRRMILDYVDTYGGISRAEAAELCQTSPNRAREILKYLVAEGSLNLVGERKASRYIRNANIA